MKIKLDPGAYMPERAHRSKKIERNEICGES